MLSTELSCSSDTGRPLLREVYDLDTRLHRIRLLRPVVPPSCARGRRGLSDYCRNSLKAVLVLYMGLSRSLASESIRNELMAGKTQITAHGRYIHSCCPRAHGNDEVYGGNEIDQRS